MDEATIRKLFPNASASLFKVEKAWNEGAEDTRWTT